MIYVVTGGRDFIGSNLLSRFIEKQKAHVKAISFDVKNWKNNWIECKSKYWNQLFQIYK